MTNPAPQPSPQVTGQLVAAREKLDGACALLLSPTPGALDRCAPLLQAAIADVTACQTAIAGRARAEPEAAAEARRLQGAVRQARCLLESAAAYHHNWARRMGVMSAGYDGRGEPAVVERGRRLIVRG
jgi:hypothetical protein